MPKNGRVIVFLACIALAIVINLVTCRWGISVNGTTVLSISSRPNAGGVDTIGLFSAPWLEGKQAWAMLLGVLLPMAMLGLGTYVLIRSPKAA